MPAGDEGRRIVEGELPAGDIGAQMDLTDLEREALAIEVHQERVEQMQRIAELVLPEKRGGQARLANDVVELASADIEMQAGTVQNPAPLPSRAMGADEERLPGERPARGDILIRLLAGFLEEVELLRQSVGQFAFDVDEPGIDVGSDDGIAHHYVPPCLAVALRRRLWLITTVRLPLATSPLPQGRIGRYLALHAQAIDAYTVAN